MNTTVTPTTAPTVPPMEKVLVSADALGALLSAARGPGHLMRELQVLFHGSMSQGCDPIGVLLAELREAHAAHYELHRKA